MTYYQSLNIEVPVQGQLVINKERFEKVDIVPTPTHLDSLTAEETVPICCAAFDPVKGIIYVGVGSHHTHDDLKRHHEELEPTHNQDYLNEVIYGFIVSGGYFVNRIQMGYHIARFHKAIVTKPDYACTKDIRINSYMIHWGRAQNVLRRYAKCNKFDAVMA